MANSRSALKRVRKTKRETSRNRALKSRLKATRKTALEAIDAGDTKAAQAAYDEFASAADKAAKKGAIHNNKASRLKSRVALKVNALSA